jgi:hypothetical protein
LTELLFVAGADDDSGNTRTLEQPVECNLRDSFSGLGGNGVESVNDLVEVVVVRRWTRIRRLLGVEAAGCGGRLTAANLARESPPAKRTPDDRADLLIKCEWHQLPFEFPSDQRVVGLMRYIPLEATLLGDRERLHQVPA